MRTNAYSLLPPNRYSWNQDCSRDGHVAICKREGIPCLDLFRSSNLRPWDSASAALTFSKDVAKVHPDENGHKIIASPILNFIRGIII
jgi:hypothetical protein